MFILLNNFHNSIALCKKLGLDNIFTLYVKFNFFQTDSQGCPSLVGWPVMLARFAREVGQCFGVDGLIEESEAGGAEKAVALCVDISHQHVVLA